MQLKTLLLSILVSTITVSSAQEIQFRDTVGNIVFDSLNHFEANLPQGQTTVTKYFKYLGGDSTPILITSVYTLDPHFIGDYPKLPLEPHKIYSIRIFFGVTVPGGSSFTKNMWMKLNNGTRIPLVVSGTVRKED